MSDKFWLLSWLFSDSAWSLRRHTLLLIILLQWPIFLCSLSFTMFPGILSSFFIVCKLAHDTLLLPKVASSTEHIFAIIGATLVIGLVKWADSCKRLCPLRQYHGLDVIRARWENVWIIFTITLLILCQLRDGLLCLVFLGVLTEASIGCLVHHEVLGLDQDQVTQERREEERDEYADDKREVKHNLRHERIWLYYLREKTRFHRSLQCVIRDQNVQIYNTV